MDIKFREIDFEKDSTAVVDLINENLKSGFTEDILKWKHLFGAFGPSKNVVAVDGDKIVAVVFAMRYNYRNLEGRIIKGIRTFDGCTDVNYRGQGIFKKVMRLCVDKFNMDWDFLMANPNEASFAEHIKLGYVEPTEDYYYKVGLVNPFGSSFENIENDEKINPEDLNLTDSETLSKEEIFLTGNSKSFINWRYFPSNYFIKSVMTPKGKSYICYRKIKKKGLNVIVLCNYFGANSELNKVVQSICKLEKTYLIYYLKNYITDNLDLLFSKKEKRAVIVFKLNKISLPDNLVISLGDLEGRL